MDTPPITNLSRLRERLQILLGTAVSLGFLWLAFRRVDWAGMWRIIGHANIWLLAAALFTVIATTIIRAERWRLMFYPHHRRLRLHKLFSIFLVGQAINAVIPIRLGELARAFLVGEIEKVSKAQALWTTVLDKVFDSLTLLLFLLALSFVVPLPPWLRQAGWALSGGLALSLVLLILGTLYQDVALRLVSGLEVRHPWFAWARLSHLLTTVFTSLRLVRTPALAIGLAGWSLAAFLVATATNSLAALALGIHLPFKGALLLLAVLQISAVVPIPTSPGRVGLFHYLCVITLGILGLQRDVALGYGLVLHVLTYLPIAVGGPIGMWLENYNWRGLSRLLRASATQRDRAGPSN